MNAFQSCPNTTDAIPLYLPQQLYLKPIARICINVQLPTQKMIGKSVSNWELMDQLRTLIRPDEFTHLKVIKTTAETIRFEAEVEHKNKLFRVLSKVDRKMVKLKDISDVLKIKAAEAKLEFPTKQAWDDYFANSKDMNEMRPGERPDTVHLSNLPTKWFVPYHMSLENDADIKPSEKIFYRIFEKFGHIRAIDIPICDPYRHRMKSHIAGLQSTTFDEAADFFEGYVQFRDYIGFTKCMDAFRHMKLLRKESRHHGSADEDAITINMSVDFDRSKHLCEASIKRREIVRDRLVTKEQDKEEKEKVAEEEEVEKKRAQRQKELDLKNEKQKRRMQREERRKTKILSQLKVKESDEINDKIAKEEKKLLQVQRKLEAIRIVEELFKRIKAKKDSAKSSAIRHRRDDEDELTKLKRISELEVQMQKEKLSKAVKGGVVLKSILGTPRHRSKSSSSNSSVERNTNKEKASTSKISPPMDNNHIQVHPADMMFPANQWHPYGGVRGAHNGMYYEQHMAPMVGPIRPEDEFYNPHVMQRLGRGGPGMMWTGGQRGGPGQYQRRPRGIYTRGRGQMGRGYNRNVPHPLNLNNSCYYPPEVQDEYFRYFQKFLNNPDDNQQNRRGSRSQSRSRSRSRARSYPRRSSRSKSRTRRRRSDSRSRSRSNRRSRSKSSRRHRSRSRSKDRSRSRSKSKSRDRRSRSGEKSTRGRYSRDHRSHSRSKSKSRRSRSYSRSRQSNTPPNRDDSGNKNHRVSEGDDKGPNSVGSGKSVDSSAFVPPIRDRRRSTRSKSWSMSKDDAATGSKSGRRTWSKSPEKI